MEIYTSLFPQREILDNPRNKSFGKSIADIIFGKVSPSGRLSISFPKKTGHIPVYYNSFRPGKSVNAYYSDVWEGARTACYIDGLAEPMYPFGYGLSYSEFKY